jgi:hypothetical protein
MEELPNTGDARRFLFHVTFEIEGTRQTRQMTWPWTYTTSRAVPDAHGGGKGDGIKECRLREMDAFRQHVEYELGAQGGRAYSLNGSDVLIWEPG